MPFSDIFEASYTHYFWDPTFFDSPCIRNYTRFESWRETMMVRKDADWQKARVSPESNVSRIETSPDSPRPLLAANQIWLLAAGAVSVRATLPSSGGSDRYAATQHYISSHIVTYRHISSHIVTLRYITSHYVNTGTAHSQWAGSRSTLSVTPPLNEGRWCAARGRGPPPRCWLYWL